MLIMPEQCNSFWLLPTTRKCKLWDK